MKSLMAALVRGYSQAYRTGVKIDAKSMRRFYSISARSLLKRFHRGRHDRGR